jgi:F1F0 ATPase subunit 2
MLVRLEVGEERMSILFSADRSPLAMLFGLTLHLALGLGLGVLYFRGLLWNVRRLTEGRRVTATIALAVGRFALLGAALVLVSLEGTAPLLATALGILIARSAVMRQFKETAR